MMFVQMVGFDRMQAFQARTDALRAILKNDWPTMQRLTTYYLNRDWHHFDRDAKALVPAEHQKFKAEWHRDHVLHHLYDLLFIPLLALDGVGRYPLMKQSWNELWTPKGRHYDRLVAFAKSSVTTPSFIASQRDLFTNIDRYVTLLSALLPGLLCNMLRREDDPVIDSLRLFRDDYELLRDFYIQSYETCHKTLRWVIGAANADHSGSWDKFAIPPGVTDIKKVPADLDAFDKVVNAEKRKWLACIPEWNLHWDFVFDRSLRNDIGHASAYHELASGNILRGKKNPLPYTRYVARVQQTLHGLLAALNVLKILRVYSFA